MTEIGWQVQLSLYEYGNIILYNAAKKIQINLDSDTSLYDLYEHHPSVPASLRYYIEVLAMKYRRTKIYQAFAGV